MTADPLSIAQLHRDVDPISSPDVGPEGLDEAIRAARALARQAYELRTPAAIAAAEKTLYALHVANAFAPPMHGRASAVWNVLALAKLTARLRPHVSKGCTNDEMKTRIGARVREAQGLDHALIDLLAESDGLSAYVMYAKNWEAHVFGFTHQLVSLAQRCTGHMQKMVAQMIVEEFLPPIDHDNLRARLMKRLGVDVGTLDRVEDPLVVIEALSLMNYRTAVCLIPNPYFALGSFYSIEAAFPDVCWRMLIGLKRRQLDDFSLEYLQLHGEADVHHSSEWMEGLQASPLSDHERACVVAGALAQIELRHEMFEGMRRKLAPA